jgi:RNA polymerase sigma factor (sigma-70 family)
MENEVSVSELGDSSLVAAARGGDKAAFAALVHRHRRLLMALCCRTVRDADLAEDAAQEAILLAMTSLDRLRDPERFGSWLAGIGLNVCRRWLQAQALTTWSLEALQGGHLDDLPMRSAGPEELLVAAEETRRVRAAIAELPPGQQTAVTLYYLGEVSQKEIADRVGTSLGAVKVRLYEGRIKLRNRLVEAEGNRP